MRSHTHLLSTRLKRARFVLQLLAVSTLTGSVALANEGESQAPGDDVLVTAFVENCCPPASIVVPACPPADCVPGTTHSSPDQGYLPTTPLPSSEGDDAAASADGSEFTPPVTDAPSAADNANINDFAAPRAQSFASTTGSRGGLNAPNMLGDLASSTSTVISPPLGGGGPATPFAISVAGTGNRRFKIAENVSPIPQDRVYFNFHHYNDALINNGVRNVNLDRYSFGGEKTLVDGLFSVELRMAIVDGFDAEQTTAGLTEGAEFGNLQFSFKGLLHSTNKSAVGAGLTLSVPTASDIELDTIGSIENESVFLAPFIGFVYQPRSNVFYQGFLQTDIVLNGDSVLDAAGAEIGVYQEQNFLYGSLSAGRWLHQNQGRGALVNGLAGMLELHYSTSLNDADTVPNFFGDITSEPRVDYLNATAAMVIQRGLTNVRIGVGSPLRTGRDENFESEFLVQVNRNF